jgi:hypothetical protein
MCPPDPPAQRWANRIPWVAMVLSARPPSIHEREPIDFLPLPSPTETRTRPSETLEPPPDQLGALRIRLKQQRHEHLGLLIFHLAVGRMVARSHALEGGPRRVVEGRPEERVGRGRRGRMAGRRADRVRVCKCMVLCSRGAHCAPWSVVLGVVPSSRGRPLQQIIRRRAARKSSTCCTTGVLDRCPPNPGVVGRWIFGVDGLLPPAVSVLIQQRLPNKDGGHRLAAAIIPRLTPAPCMEIPRHIPLIIDQRRVRQRRGRNTPRCDRL